MEKYQLLQLLANNELEALFEALRQEFPNQQAELALLEGQWQGLREKIRDGVLTQEQAFVREAQIRSSLKDFILQTDSDSAFERNRPATGLAWLAWILPLVALAAGWVVWTFFINPDTGSADYTGNKPDTQSTVEQQAVSDEPARLLDISKEIIRINAQHEGSIAYQFLDAKLAPYNSGHLQLSLHLRCIKPEFGKDVSALVIHLEHGEEEIAPYHVEFPFVQAMTTGEGTLFFEVPKIWEQVNILIYHGVPGSVITTRIPLELN